MLRVDAHFAFGQVAHVAERRLDGKTFAQKRANGLGFGGGLDDHEFC